MNPYMQSVEEVAEEVVKWRKVAENKQTFGGRLILQVALVILNIELGGKQIPNNSANFRGLVIGRVKEMELDDDCSDPELRV
jgi:cell wall assembly regulator SMI1